MSGDSLGEHGQAVKGMFGRIARWYDLLNHSLSLGQDIWWRKRLVSFVRPGDGPFCDLAAGTLDVSMELLRKYPDVPVIAADFTLPMLEEGKRKKINSENREHISPVQADGRYLPLADNSVSAVTIAFGIRNIKPREAAFNEIYRVLEPGGRLCVLEFGSGQQRIWNGVYNLYLNRLLPLLGKLVSGDGHAYQYLADTIREFPTADALGMEMKRAGFDKMLWQPILSGIVYIHVAEKARESE